MLIKRITIRNFGKIHNRTFEFSDGINLLYGENESGKTTLHTFIKCMFYGIPRTRGRAAKNDTYRTYEPWENPGDYGGTIWFESEGMSYRLTRNFSRERPFAELLCQNNGALLNPDDGALEEILGNVSEAVYDNTVSIGQMKSVTGQDLVHELQNYMAGYEGSADSTIDIQRASQMLKMTRKGFQVQENRRKKAIDSEQIRILSRITYLEEEEKKLDARMQSIRGKINELDPDGSGTEYIERRIMKTRRKAHYIGLTSALVSCILLILAMFMLRRSFRAAAVICAVIVLAFGFIRRYMLGREADRLAEYCDEWKEHYKKLTWEMLHTERALVERQTAIENLREEYSEGEDALYRISPEAEEVRAINIALSTIESLSVNINTQVGTRLRERTSRILAGITNGKYTEVLMNEELKMAVNTEARVVPLERLSRGTLEQIYFSLRMAAGELFCGGVPFPVILDDVFGTYDEERLKSLLMWLRGEKRQVMISTCSSREAELMLEEKIKFNELLL
ncbi:MAG: AAA family ATPase [Blautia sp.]|nr:AAA family ATPase [Blautia sp.]